MFASGFWFAELFRQYNGPSTGSESWQLPLRTAIATSNPSDPGRLLTSEQDEQP